MAQLFYHAFDKKVFWSSIIVGALGLLLIFFNIANHLPLPLWITEHSNFSFSNELFLLGLILIIGGGFGIWKSFRTNYCTNCKIPAETHTSCCDPHYEGAFTQMLQLGELKNVTGLKVLSDTHVPRLEIEVEYCPACVACAKVTINKIESGQKTLIIKDQFIVGPVVRSLKDTLLL